MIYESKTQLQIPPTKTISFGINSLTFRGSILWNAMPDTIKSAENVFRFKKRHNSLDWRQM